jgi:transposase
MKGAVSTKIHMLADALGRPLRLVISAGQVHDCTQADRLLEDIETTHVIADKGYNSERVLEKIKELGASPVIPPKFNRRVQREYDQEL